MSVATNKEGIEYFKLDTPLIPLYVFSSIEQFFYIVSKRHNTEALCRIFYSKDNGFTVDIPPQKCSYASVEANNSKVSTPFEPLVLEIHSHGKIQPFWSSVDNQDELKNPGIYGVFGGVNKQCGSIFRVSFNGHTKSIRASELFDFELINGDMSREELYEQWLEKAIVF